MLSRSTKHWPAGMKQNVRIFVNPLPWLVISASSDHHDSDWKTDLNYDSDYQCLAISAIVMTAETFLAAKCRTTNSRIVRCNPQRIPDWLTIYGATWAGPKLFSGRDAQQFVRGDGRWMLRVYGGFRMAGSTPNSSKLVEINRSTLVLPILRTPHILRIRTLYHYSWLARRAVLIGIVLVYARSINGSLTRGTKAEFNSFRFRSKWMARIALSHKKLNSWLSTLGPRRGLTQQSPKRL